MANTYVNPSLDPSYNNSLVGSISFAFSKLMQSTDGMLPAQVISYDRTTNRVTVNVLISLVKTDGSSPPPKQISSLPVLLLGGGNFFLSFPIRTGDLGWIVAADRDISLFLQSYSQATPNTLRVKDFSSGLFVPDLMRGYALAPDSDNNVTLQTADGTVSIVMSSTGVTVNAAETVTINATHNLNVNAGANAVFTMNSGLGTFGVDGNITASGTITEGVLPPPP